MIVGAVLVSVSIFAGAKIMSAALDRLKAEVAETRGVAASAVAALSAIPQLIRDAIENSQGDLESELNTLADDLDSSQADLAGAINANPGPADPGGDTVTDPADDSIGGGEGDDTIGG